MLSLSSGTQTIRGLSFLTDEDGDVDGPWHDCEGTGGYSDFRSGLALSIRGESDEIVGSGFVRNLSEELLPTVVEMDWESGDLIGLDESDDQDVAVDELRSILSSAEGFLCVLYYEAQVEDSDFYSIEIGRRGSLEYSRSELVRAGWVVSSFLGDA